MCKTCDRITAIQKSTSTLLDKTIARMNGEHQRLLETEYDTADIQELVQSQLGDAKLKVEPDTRER